MIAPRRHVGDILSLKKPELGDFTDLAVEQIENIKKKLKPQGMNIGMNIGKTAGAGFASHIHLHIVPRWDGDTNFMTACADTRVVSHALEEVYRRLRS
jgi:ATP adenylyltransferase